MKKTFVIILILVVVVLGSYFVLKNQEAQAPTTEIGDTSMPSEDDSSQMNQSVVTYTDTGYSPSTLTIKAGTTVTFANDSFMSMWTASAVHPTHAVYPTTGGCLGSTFDACKGVLPGETWSFKFDEVGSWKYHDHLTPTFYGTIVVK